MEKEGTPLLKRLAHCIREYRRDTILAPFFVSCEVFLEVLIPWLMAKLIDNGIDQGDMGYIIRMGLLLVVAALASLVFGVLSGISAARASAGFAKNLRHDMFYRVQDFSFTNIDHFSPASIVTRLTTDVNNIQNAFQMLIRIAVRAPLMLIFAMVMAFRVNTELALIFVAVTPVLGVGMFLLVRHAFPLFDRVFKIYDKLNNVVGENLHGIRVVKSFVREEHEVEKFRSVSKDIYDTFSRAERTVVLNMPLMQFCVYACMIFISWQGAGLIVAGDMTPGLLMTMFSYVMQILMSLMMVAMILTMLTISRAAARRICELLNEESDLSSGTAGVREVPDGSIEFQNVSFSYAKDKNKLCLRGIDLKIRSGETVGILGGTGAAKSTLVQLIPRLYDATEGTVLVGGRDVREYDLTALRDAVAMVLQKNTLFSGTIQENLRWGDPNASEEELRHACRLAQADEFIDRFPDGYQTYIEQGGANVSGGQKQRLCIARALLKSPKILILDDSTSAVDMKTDAQIRQAFAEEIPGTTKLIIAQRIASVQDADHILVLDGGKIDGWGTHESLLQNNKIYREVYESQMKGGDEDA